MRTGLLILPFLALLVAAFGVAMGSAFPEAGFVKAVGLAVSFGIFALWVVLDLEGFRSFFTRKGARYGASSGLVLLLGVAVIVGVAVLSTRPRFNKTYDVTRDKLNTLSEQSFKLLETLKKDGKQIRFVAFFTDEAAKTQFTDLVNLYQASGADLVVEHHDPNADRTLAIAEKITDANTVIVRQGQQEKRMTTFTEEKLTNALVAVLKEKTKKICFSKGHGEGAIKGSEANGFSMAATELENNKNAIEEVSLLETAKVPEDCDALVLAGPKYDFKEEEVRMVEDYLKRGGSVLSMVPALSNVDNLNKMLEKFGVKYASDLLILAPNDPRAQLLGQNLALVSEFDDFNPVTKDFAAQSQVAIGLRNTRSLDKVDDNQHKLKVSLAGKTAKIMVRVKDVYQPKDLENLSEDRWEQGSFPVIAVANGKTQAPATANNEKKDGKAEDIKSDALNNDSASQAKETRLVAVGAVDFASNQGMQEPSSRDLFLNIINYLTQDDDFISIRPRDPTKSTIDISSGSAQLSLLALTFIYPFVFLFGGLYMWLQRRRA